MAAACLVPGSAFAVERRPLAEKFGVDGTSGTFFERPGALGFDQGSKRLYVLDAETQLLHGFDSSTPGTHTPLGGSFPLSAPAGEFNAIAADNSSHNIYYATPSENNLYGFDQSGATLTGFPVSGQNYSCGTAVDSSGDIWVSEGNEGKLKKYSPSGALIETLSIGGEPCSLAFDTSDNLYVGFYVGPTKKYTAASGYATATQIDGSTTRALAVDQTTNEVYVVHYNYVSVYGADGVFLYEFGAGVFGGFSGIAIDEATEEVYLADGEAFQVDVFAPPLPFPALTAEGATGITATEATVHGTINPKGQAVEDCHFEVVSAEEFQAHGYEYEIENDKEEKELVKTGVQIPCVPAAGSIPVDSNPHTVSGTATGLSAATAYRYRLVATNPIGETKGTDRAFTTGAVAPQVEEESVEAVGTGEATVAAEVNPRGGQTTYHVEYGTTASYGQSTSESAPLGFPTDNSKHTVSVHLSGLAAGTAYHFRFVATNEAGSAEGADTSFATYPTTSPTFGPCPDERFRTGFGTQLPDCRAYEQGTPTDKHGADALASISSVGVSPSGDRFSFFATGGLPTTGGLSSIVPFIASRGPHGWSTDGLLPSTKPGFVGSVLEANEELSATLVKAEGPGGVGQQLFVRHSDTATYEPGPSVSEGSFFPFLIGFAADPAHLAFTVNNQLLPSATAGKSNLYDLDHGVLTLADRIPAGSTISCDDEAGPACIVSPEGSIDSGNGGKIARDGAEAFVVKTPGGPNESGRIYLREDGIRTTWISASQRTTPDPGGEKPAFLVSITPDGSKVFFTSCEKLTDDSTAVSTGENACQQPGQNEGEQGADLYSYDIGTGELTDLTVDSHVGDTKGAKVNEVLGTSSDGSSVYFTADGVLAPGASAGACPNYGSSCSLYVYHDGVTAFIARIANTDLFEAGGGARVAGDGSAVLFSSRESLTGFNNLSCRGGLGTTIPCTEFFRYSTSEEKLTCVSCVPTGLPAVAPARLGNPAGLFIKGNARGAQSRNLSSDGNRAFFESADALVKGDTNGVYDVYEWEAKGTGSCESESQNGGCLYLISTGTSPEPAQFLGASANGDHVFFLTGQRLVPGDEDQLYDVYDAGVGAGLADQHELAPPTCSSTACQANPAPPPDRTAASAVYSGPGNAHPGAAPRKCPKGKRKVRQGAKVHCQKARKQHKRHHNRGGSK